MSTMQCTFIFAMLRITSDIYSTSKYIGLGIGKHSSYVVITSGKEVMFSLMSVCWLVVWFVCQHDCTKARERMSTELNGRMGHWPRRNSLNIWAELAKGADPEMTEQGQNYGS